MSSLSVVLAGSSGFLGSHLRTELERRGHAVTALVRRPARDVSESSWDPATGVVDPTVVAEADVVVNLAGSPTLGNPHSSRWARELRESRVSTTGLLAATIAASARPPAFLAGNGVGWYGDHGDAELTEAADSRGHSFMTGVCREWQGAAAPAVEAGGRVCFLRTAPVQDRRSAPFKQQALQFKAGLGGRIGAGRQWMPLISLRDWVGAVAFLVEHPTATGPVNLSCAEPATNAEFTSALADAVRRPAVLPAPAPLVRLAAGRVAPDVLGSMRVRPAALLGWSYEFADPTVVEVVASGLDAA